MKNTDNKKPHTGYIFLTIFVFLGAGILISGYFAYRNYEQKYRTEVEHQLAAVADLKVDQLVQWRKERLGDANVFYKNNVFSDLVKRYFKNPNDAEAKRWLQAWMGQISSAYAYNRICLHDLAGTERISFPEGKILPPLIFSVRSAEVVKSGKVEFQDFYLDENDKNVYLTIFVPVLDESGNGKALGVLALRIDPTQYLYPMIEKWPALSKTAETLIVRTDGDDALFLNELRFKKNGTLNLRIPLSDINTLAVKAILGKEGIVEGVDYRGVPVIGEVRAIPDSPWFLVARIDIDEVYASLRERMWLMIILVSALLIGAGAGLGSAWRHLHNRFYREQYQSAEALRESEALLQSITDNSTSLIYIVDTEGRFLLVNRTLESLLSIRREKLLGQTREIVLPKEIAELHRNNDLKIFSSGSASIFEEENVEQDGTHVYLTVKFPLFTVDQKIYAVGGISTDITERKRAEEILESQNALLAALINSSSDILIFSLDRNYCYTTFNERHREEMKRVWNVEIELGMNLLDCMHIPELREQAKQSIDRAFSGAMFSETQHQPDHDIYYELNWNPILQHREVIGVTVFIRNITERKRAEEQLRETNEYLENLFNYANAPIIVWDPSLVITRFNHAFEQLSGIPAEEVIGKKIDVLFPKEKIDSTLDLINRAVSGERWETVEIEIQRKDGGSRIVLWNSANILDTENKVVIATIAQGHDITKRKQAEAEVQRLLGSYERSRQALLNILEDQKQAQKALSALSSRQEAILSAVPDIIMEVDNHKVYTWSNQSGINFFGEDVIGKEAAFFFEGEQETYNLVQPLFNGNENIIYVESWQRRKDGQKRLLGWWCRMLKDENGNVVGALSSGRDITESKLVEERIRLSEENFRNVFEHAAVGKSITSLNGNIRVNKAFCNILGYAEEELSKSKWQNITHPDDIEQDQKIINSIISRERNTARWQKRYIHKEGNIVWVDVSTVLQRDSAGQPMYFITTVNDITELKRVEEEIIKLNAELELRVLQRTSQLEAVNKELEAFSYSVSHDLRAPLRHISGYVDLLGDQYQKELPKKGQHYLEEIIDSVRQMGVLIDDLLKFSRTGRVEIRESTVDMNKIVEEVSARLHHDNPQRDIEWSIARLPSVHCDNAMMHLVWENLLSNAVKFTRTRKKAIIEVGVREEAKEFVFVVRDNGVGFDMQYAQKLFGVFQRMHSTAEFEGTGVGLANVHRIILRHGGRAWAEAELDKGATFYFSLLK